MTEIALALDEMLEVQNYEGVAEQLRIELDEKRNMRIMNWLMDRASAGHAVIHYFIARNWLKPLGAIHSYSSFQNALVHMLNCLLRVVQDLICCEHVLGDKLNEVPFQILKRKMMTWAKQHAPFEEWAPLSECAAKIRKMHKLQIMSEVGLDTYSPEKILDSVKLVEPPKSGEEKTTDKLNVSIDGFEKSDGELDKQMYYPLPAWALTFTESPLYIVGSKHLFWGKPDSVKRTAAKLSSMTIAIIRNNVGQYACHLFESKSWADIDNMSLRNFIPPKMMIDTLKPYV